MAIVWEVLIFLPAVGFVMLGLWHLYNMGGGSIAQPPVVMGHDRHYRLVRQAELFTIALLSCISIASSPLRTCTAADWSISTIPTISLYVFTYGTLAFLMDVTTQLLPTPQEVLHVLTATALSQELLLVLFHLRSVGFSSSWLIAAGAILCLVILEIIAILRSALVPGTWFMQMGIVILTPSLFPPKSCNMATVAVVAIHHADITAIMILFAILFSLLLVLRSDLVTLHQIDTLSRELAHKIHEDRRGAVHYPHQQPAAGRAGAGGAGSAHDPRSPAGNAA